MDPISPLWERDVPHEVRVELSSLGDRCWIDGEEVEHFVRAEPVTLGWVRITTRHDEYVLPVKHLEVVPRGA